MLSPAAADRLAQINRAFYAAHAEAFGATRPRLPAGVARLLALPEVAPTLTPAARVLEVGCGDGKVGRWLAARGVPYLGLDASAAMLDRARRLTTGAAPRFLQADLLAPGWEAALAGQTFTHVLALAVFHHLPGAAARQVVAHTLVRHLTPNGLFAMSNWQFTRSPRLRQRVAPWSAAGLTADEVEPNDYLLNWERAGRPGLRYVHLLETAEARQLAEAAGLTVRAVFGADGATGDLAEYVLASR